MAAVEHHDLEGIVTSESGIGTAPARALVEDQEPRLLAGRRRSELFNGDRRTTGNR
jgi:hypothetical protein